MYYPTWVDVFTFIGSLGIFFTLFLLFIRFLPMVAMSEVKAVLPEADPHYHPPSFPIHGMNKAMSLGKSPLGYIIFWGGFTGFLTAVLLEYNPFFFSLSVDRARETGKLFHGPGLFPDYVRTDRVALGFHGFFRSIRVESAAAAAPSTLRSRTFHAGNK